MTTIRNEIEISGIGLMDGRESRVKLVPSNKQGIYIYPDNSDVGIKACLDNVISTLHCTVLGNQEKQIRVVEHFMAACALTGIDSLNIYLSSSEMPILDGSALEWVNAFRKAGIEESNGTKSIEINEPVYLNCSNTNLALLPAKEFKITYMINFEHPDMRNKWFSWSLSDDHNQIIEARTFGYLKDLEKFQQAGFALGAKIENTIGLTETGYTVELRSENELIKHKILDLIGDLNLLDINPLNFKAHIIAQEAGHKTHVEFARVIQNYMERKLCKLAEK